MENQQPTRHENLQASVKALIEEIVSLDPESLMRSEDFGKLYTFEPIVPHARIVKDHVYRINTDSLAILSEHTLDQITRICSDIKQYIDQIKAFDPKEYSQDAEQQYSKLLERSISAFKKLPHELLPIIAYTSSDAASIAETLHNAKNIEGKIKGLFDQAGDILDNIKGVSAETGVSSQANFYDLDAMDHKFYARVWLGVSIFTGLTIAILAYILLYDIEPSSVSLSVSDAIIKVAGKTLIFAAFTSLLVLFVKNYAASRHNHIVNRHRHNALRTYQTLVEAAADTANADIVLTHAAQCIFADQPTGYSKHDSVESSHIPQIVFNPIGPVSNTK